MKSSMGIATSVSYLDVPREPSSSETRAIVLSSGASTTLMKSKWPSVAHCALTLAPSCSTSLLTSRMRAGLFLTVWTPSGVSVESMMYVGTAFLPGWLGGPRRRSIRSFGPRAVFRDPDACAVRHSRRRGGVARARGRTGRVAGAARPLLSLAGLRDARDRARLGNGLHARGAGQ